MQVLLPVTLRDERMTTVEARGLMYNEGLGKIVMFEH